MRFVAPGHAASTILLVSEGNHIPRVDGLEYLASYIGRTLDSEAAARPQVGHRLGGRPFNSGFNLAAQLSTAAALGVHSQYTLEVTTNPVTRGDLHDNLVGAGSSQILTTLIVFIPLKNR